MVVDLSTSRIACTFLPSLWYLVMIFGFASCGFTSVSVNFHETFNLSKGFWELLIDSETVTQQNNVG